MGKEKELVILFADVVGSTRLYEVLGDLTARDKVAVCVDIMRRATEQRGGSVVKTMGDEILATFEDCDKAMDAAVQMQVAIEAHPELDVERQHIAIRIGCHFGPVVLETREHVRRAAQLGVDVRERTDALSIAADVLLIACGADSPALARGLGVDLPVRALVRQLADKWFSDR